MIKLTYSRQSKVYDWSVFRHKKSLLFWLNAIKSNGPIDIISIEVF